MDYLETSIPTDEFTQGLERKVEEVKRNDEWRENFVTIEQKIELESRVARERGREAGLAEGREVGLAEGRAEGEEAKLLSLISKKIAKGKSVAQIADECEETEDYVRELIKRL